MDYRRDVEFLEGFASAGTFFTLYKDYLNTPRGMNFFLSEILPSWYGSTSQYGRGRLAGFLSAWGE